MYLSHLKLYNFRNYDSLDLELNKNINIIIGDNAQGKTSLLESIFLLGRGKSYKNNNSELINWDNDNCSIEGE
ncbi:MAG: AAA family ATPase, partial [Eubacteriaceae bacterium]